MRQRLGIAQAMLGLPEVLVLDEPTNGLDPPQIAEMREVLADYAHTGRTVVVSSHLLAEVEQTCTDVVVMHRGKIVAAGSVAEIAGGGEQQLAVDDPAAAVRILAAAGVGAQFVPGRRALEDVFLGLIGDDPQ
jgi:ABC-2 type transport system ATP-binding protein